MTETESRDVIDHLERTRGLISRLTAALSAAQWDFREAPDRWTIAEVIEHLALVEASALGHIETRLSEQPAPEQRPLVTGRDERVLTAMLLRENRASSPRSLSPTGRWPGEQALAEFQAARQRTLIFARDCPHDLRAHIFPHRVMGEIDGYQWLLFMSGHSERHALQIEEIQSRGDYPAANESRGGTR